ncbi:hypothetical protein HRbin08_01932 [bacterium HR08]|nr:hypothetical protein HRbin08_01932 [bacterium HR08]
MWALLRRTFRDLEMDVSRSARHRTELTSESAEPPERFADGEYARETPVTVEIVPRAPHIIAP